TPREQEVFTQLVRGKPHKQIAYALGTSERTVKMHRHNVMQKFQVRSLAELAVAAERLGLLSVSDRRGGEGAAQAEQKSKQTTSTPSLNGHASPAGIADARRRRRLRCAARQQPCIRAQAIEFASIAFRKGLARSNEGCVQMHFP